MDVRLTWGEWKSLDTGFEWRGIPRFAVLSGPNGSGKSHILDALYRGIAPDPQQGTAGFQLEVVGESYGYGEVVLSTSEQGVRSGTSGIGQISDLSRKTTALMLGTTRPGNQRQVMENRLRMRWLSAEAGLGEWSERGGPSTKMSADQITRRLPYSFGLSAKLDLPSLTGDLAHTFVAYQLKRLQRVMAPIRSGRLATQSSQSPLRPPRSFSLALVPAGRGELRGPPRRRGGGSRPLSSVQGGWGVGLEKHGRVQELSAGLIGARVIDDRVDLAEAGVALGSAPWTVFNELLEAAGLRYSVVEPSTTLTENYALRLKDRDREVDVGPSELSSGERAVMGLAAWLLTASEFRLLPKLILLDEPDAHLHTSMLPGFFEMVRRLVDKWGARVLMSTHRLETVSLAPQDSLFEVFREPPRVRPAPNRAASIHRLTLGLLRVAAPRKCVLVEDDDDAAFYSASQRVLADETEEPDGGYSLSFVSAGIGKGKNRESGGRNKVEQWSGKLRKSGLQEWVVGLVDRDFESSAGEGVHLLARHSIENYLLDPIVVFAALLGRRRVPELKLSRSIPYGSEALIPELPVDDLKRIAGVILSPVAALLSLDSGESAEVEVDYQTGAKLMLPRWLLDRRGKDLCTVFRGAWDGTALGTRPLIDAFEKVRMVPEELANLFEMIQRGGGPSDVEHGP